MFEPDLQLKINEIFHSIQGESDLVGWPTVFVRTTGCNLRCTYCDTKYSYFEGEKTSLSSIIEKIKSYKSKHVCITGGEPMAQPNILPLMTQLCDLGFVVSLETSGSFSVKNVDRRVMRIIDIKTPGSGEEKSFDFENLEYLHSSDQIKFVLCNNKDYEWAKNFMFKYNLHQKCGVFLSPSFDEMSPRELASKIIEDSLPARLQLQVHKYIWNPNQRGV